MRFRPRLILLGALLLSGLIAEANPVEPARIPLLEAPLPAYPAELRDKPIYRGFAVVGCVVAADGSVTKAWTLRLRSRSLELRLPGGSLKPRCPHTGRRRTHPGSVPMGSSHHSYF